jgi:hypothetical protein
MFFILALLAAQTEAGLLLADEIVTVPPSDLRTVDISLRQRPAMVECRFHVGAGEPEVRAMLMTVTDAERFRHGEAHTILAATPYENQGRFRVAVSEPGDYQVVLDNHMEGHRPARVRLKVTLFFHAEAAIPARYAPKERQYLAIGLGLTFFVVVAVFSGVKLRRAMLARGTRGPLPPFL